MVLWFCKLFLAYGHCIIVSLLRSLVVRFYLSDTVIFHHSPFQHYTSQFSYSTFTCAWSLIISLTSACRFSQDWKIYLFFFFYYPNSEAFFYCLFNHLLLVLVFHFHTAAHFSVLLDKAVQHFNLRSCVTYMSPVTSEWIWNFSHFSLCFLMYFA